MSAKCKYVIDLELENDQKDRIDFIKTRLTNHKYGEDWNWDNFVTMSIKLFDEVLDKGITGEQYRSFIDQPDLCLQFKKQKESRNKCEIVELDEIIGLDEIKNKIKRLANLRKKAFWMRNSMNYVFVGNPGTGKTMMARALAREFYKNNLIKEDKLVEVDRSDLIAEYTGQTAPKVKRCFLRALGGVLFIDEAYSIHKSRWGDDYGDEALGAINKLMEDYRGQLVVIFAGYKKETIEMLEKNPGLKSRINEIFDFKDYSREELRTILKATSKKMLFEFETDAEERLLDIIEAKRYSKSYGNARDLRKTFEGILEFWALREPVIELWNKIILDDVINWQIENHVVLTKDVLDA